MKGSLSNHKYIKVEVRIDPMAREVTKIGQIVGVRDILQIIVQDRTIEATDLEETPEGIADRMIEEITGMKDIITITEMEVDQKKGISQEITITAETEVQAIVDPDQGLEPVQIEIE